MDAIDLFAGLGGFSTGAEQAGAKVRWAINHWPVAVEYHRKNHPGTVHECAEVERVDWSSVPAHDLLMASPACQGHSRARGKDRPHHDIQRATAWAVVAAAEVQRPSVIVVENVPEFLSWVLYPAWSSALEALGYTLAPHIINAADLGVPQNRVRVFIVATLSKNPITLTLPTVPHLPARSIIDLDGGRWSPVSGRAGRPRAAATLARIAKGREQFGAEFLLAYYGGERGGRSLDAPLGTVRTREAHAVVRGDEMRMLTIDEYRRAMGFPEGTALPSNKSDAVKLLGNAVVPAVAKEVVRQVMAA